MLRDKFAAARDSAPWFDEYHGKSISLAHSGTQILLDEQALMRAAVKYGAAIERCKNWATTFVPFTNAFLGGDYEIQPRRSLTSASGGRRLPDGRAGAGLCPDHPYRWGEEVRLRARWSWPGPIIEVTHPHPKTRCAGPAG